MASSSLSFNGAPLTASKAVQSDSNGFLESSATTNTELGYVNGVTSAIQTQLNANVQVSNRKNILIGGLMDSNPWQRGTSKVGANGFFQADRFIYASVGVGILDYKRTADAPTVAESGMYSVNCLHLDVTTADASIAAGDIYYLRNSVEGYDWAQIAQRAFTLSFWHKHTITGTYCVAFINSGSDRSYVAEYTQSTTNTWEFATINVSASPTGGTWDYTTGRGIGVNFTLAGGSTYQTTKDAWQTGNYWATSSQVNGMSDAANNFKIDRIFLQAGSTATEFEIRSADEELALCKRYFNRLVDGSGQYMGVTYNYLTTATLIVLEYPVTMRASPTLAVSNVAHFEVLDNTGSAIEATALTFTAATPRATRASATVASGLVAGEAGAMLSKHASATYDLSAEL